MLRLFKLLAAMSLLTSCSTAPEHLRIFWPPPPEQPRLEFIDIYSSQGDFPKTALQKFIDSISDDYPPAFNRPFGIVANGQGKVYIADSEDRDVKIFDFNAKTISYLTSKGCFGMPLGLAFDNDGNLYVVDGQKKKVMVFSPQHVPLFSFGDNKTMVAPSYIAINDHLGRIYVSEGRKHRITVFDMQGRHLFHIGQPGIGDGQFAAPQGLAIDSEGRLFVADMLNSRIQVFDADGNFVYSFIVAGDPDWPFENPKDLAFGSDGNLYVIDQRQALLLSYTPKGRLLLIVGSKKRTTHPLGFASPTSVYIDSTDRIYITDLLNKRFTVWQNLSKDYLRRHPITEGDIETVLEIVKARSNTSTGRCCMLSVRHPCS